MENVNKLLQAVKNIIVSFGGVMDFFTTELAVINGFTITPLSVFTLGGLVILVLVFIAHLII